MAEEGEAEWGVATDAVQSVFGGVRDLGNGVSAEVCQFMGFDVAPHLLNRIEVWRIARQALDT